MKRICAIILMMFVWFASFSQAPMTFKGYELNCTAKELSTKLVKQGFELVDVVLDMYNLKGTFAGENSRIMIMGDSDSKLVTNIMVHFDKVDDWNMLRNKYMLFKADLAKKYGEGESTEKFTEPYRDGDGNELEALSSEKCTYNTRFTAQNGKVVLTISKDHSLLLIYLVDTKKIQEQQRSSDL